MNSRRDPRQVLAAIPLAKRLHLKLLFDVGQRHPLVPHLLHLVAGEQEVLDHALEQPPAAHRSVRRDDGRGTQRQVRLQLLKQPFSRPMAVVGTDVGMAVLVSGHRRVQDALLR